MCNNNGNKYGWTETILWIKIFRMRISFQVRKSQLGNELCNLNLFIAVCLDWKETLGTAYNICIDLSQSLTFLHFVLCIKTRPRWTRLYIRQPTNQPDELFYLTFDVNGMNSSRAFIVKFISMVNCILCIQASVNRNTTRKID